MNFTLDIYTIVDADRKCLAFAIHMNIIGCTYTRMYVSREEKYGMQPLYQEMHI